MNVMMLKKTGNALPGFVPWMALISILMLLVPSCSSAPVSEDDSRAEEVSMAEFVSAKGAANSLEHESESKGAPLAKDSCDELRVQQVVRKVRGMEPAQSKALKRLNEQCSVSDWGALKPFECSCEALEEFLHASQAVKLWEGACCASSTSCSRDGRCAPVELEGAAFVNRLFEAQQVATALGQIGLHCERPVCQATQGGCQQSEVCARSGRCGLDRRGSCAPMTESHCAESTDCRDSAMCRLDEPGRACRLDCTHSSMCQEQGYCFYDENARWCKANEPGHCQESAACAEEGRCYLETLEDYQDREWRMGEPPRGCYSKVDRAVENARDTLDQTLKTAMVPLLRMALKEEGAGRARVQISSAGLDYEELESVFYVDVSVPPSDSLRARYRVDCKTFYEEVRALRPATVHQNANYQILADPYRLRTSEHVLVDHLESACAPNGSTHVLPMSWVGPILSLLVDSYHEDYYGRGYASEYYRTFDLRTGEAARLDALIEPASIIEAIKGDSWVQQYIERTEARIAREETSTEEKEEAIALLANFHGATDLFELEGLLQELVSRATRHYSKPSFQGYAFYTYDAKKNRVALRLSLGFLDIGRIEVPTVLGLWVEPRQEFKETFRQAHAEGRLMAGGNVGLPGISGAP